MNRTLPALCVVLFVGAGVTQDAKKEVKDNPIKFNLDYMEKMWGVKLKSATVDEKQGGIELLLEFTKDLDSVADLRIACYPPKKKAKPTMLFYLFDNENTVILKVPSSNASLEITGVKGDAFKVYLGGLENQIKQIRKVEPRANKAELK